jgi:hypothetical protein
VSRQVTLPAFQTFIPSGSNTSVNQPGKGIVASTYGLTLVADDEDELLFQSPMPTSTTAFHVFGLIIG